MNTNPLTDRVTPLDFDYSACQGHPTLPPLKKTINTQPDHRGRGRIGSRMLRRTREQKSEMGLHNKGIKGISGKGVKGGNRQHT